MLKKFTWGHGVALALGLFIIFILSMIFYFTSTWKNSELITDDYYEAELAYQDVIDAKEFLAANGGAHIDVIAKIENRAGVDNIDEICEVVKIKDVYHKLIGHLSKGYKQRVGIAQALVGNPPVIIFDEPTIGLDPKQIIEIRNLIRTLGREHTVILSTHILGEVQAVCDRIVIINKGKIVADELTENISRAVENTRRFNVKISGPQREVLAMLRNMSGICYAEVLAARDGDAYTYMIESDVGVDIRKKLFFTLAEKKWPMIGMEALGMSIEDIFIAVVDKSGGERQPAERKKSRSIEAGRAAAEREMAEQIMEKTAREAENAPDADESAPEGKYYEDYTPASDSFRADDGDKE